MNRYFIIYKPYLVLSQFSVVDDKQTLQHFFKLPKNVYPVGRLDFDSEGLLLLTNDASLNHRLLHPQFQHEKEYWAQVEGVPTDQHITQLYKGVSISVDGNPYLTKSCKATLLQDVPELPERNPPIRFRKHIPTTWLSIVVTEGKNRQIRKMTAAIGFPTLRLVRYRIQNMTIQAMQPGEIIELSKKSIYKKLFNE
ncbi:MAG: pseudouridine synthase [Chitinophagaceae bacterium]